jgi:hypothetical protein
VIKIIKSLLIVLFLASFSLQAHSETSWITKKDKTKKTLVKKTETKAKNEWIKKKKKEKEKKVIKKVKEKIKESKSWITKKSKKEKKVIKKKLKEYYDINNLPKADLYFAAKIFPKNENEESLYFYGYVNSENSSATFEYQNNKYHSKSNGVAYFEDKKTSCEVNSRAGVLFDSMKGDVVLNCSNNLIITGDFKQDGESGKGSGGTTKKNEVIFEFYSSKNDAIAKLELYKENTKTLITRSLPAPRNNKNPIIINPEGKYYALIIANSTYDNKKFWSDLKSPSNDAKAIKKIFDKKYEFENTWLIEDASRGEIYEEFEKLKSIVTDKDYLLIYYTGHGSTDINEAAYWIPKEGTDKYYSWVNVNALTNTLEDIKAKHILFMIDSCFSGLTFKSQNISDDKLVSDKVVIEEALLYYSRRVLTSGTGNKRVLDVIPGEKHSLFAKGFIKELNENKGNLLAENVWQKLKYYHKGKNVKQVPRYGTIDALSLSESTGDFVFHIPIKKQ